MSISRKNAIAVIFPAMAQAHTDYNYSMQQSFLPMSEAFVQAMLMSADENAVIEFAEVYESLEDAYIRCNGMESFFIVQDIGTGDMLKATWYRKHVQ